MKHAKKPTYSKAKTILFFAVSFALVVLDRLTKIWADKAMPGDVLVENVGGLFEFRLVHNTGAAWGIFSNSTLALGIFSCVVCGIILVAFFAYFRNAGSVFQVVCLALVFAGGIGNAIDRLVYTYVVDFINALFINFPVFNVADIGVTCGIILFFIGSLIADTHARFTAKES